MERVFTRSEVARHCTADDAWIIVGGRVYDVTNCLKKHPPGFEVTLEQLGKDCTEVVNSTHTAATLARMAKQCDLGRAVAAVHLHVSSGGASVVEDPSGGTSAQSTNPIMRSRTLPDLQQSPMAGALANAIAIAKAQQQKQPSPAILSTSAPSAVAPIPPPAEDPPSSPGSSSSGTLSPPTLPADLVHEAAHLGPCPSAGSSPGGSPKLGAPSRLRVCQTKDAPALVLAPGGAANESPQRARSQSPESPTKIVVSYDGSPIKPLPEALSPSAVAGTSPVLLPSPTGKPSSRPGSPRGLTVVMNDLSLDQRRKPQLNRMRSSPNMLCVKLSPPEQRSPAPLHVSQGLQPLDLKPAIQEPPSPL